MNIQRHISLAAMLAGLAGLILTSARSDAAMTNVQTLFIIPMENQDWADIRGNLTSAPYINNTILPMAARAEDYHTPPSLTGVPSLPSYLWLEAGTNFNVTSDVSVATGHQSSTNHLVTLLKKAGISWRSYQEDIPGTTCPTTNFAKYLPRHNPVVYFDDVICTQSTPCAYCTNNIRPYTQLAADLAGNTVARYNFITPNSCNDMHDSSGCATSDQIKNGDNWLAANLPAILNSQAYSNNGAIFILWDEPAGNTDNTIGMILISPLAKTGYSNTVHYTHSSTLRTWQEILGVGPLLGDAANATNFSDLFGAVIVASNTSLTAESCAPNNGLIDPGETVTVNFTLKNTAGFATTTGNLIATLQATGGVTSPSAAQSYGAIAGGTSQTRAFTFTANGSCGGSITATLQLTDGATNCPSVTFTLPLGQITSPLTQNFDSVTAPVLPASWTTSASGAQSNWVTATTAADTAPNAAFTSDNEAIGVNELDSPSFAVSSSAAQLAFRQFYNLTGSSTNAAVGYDGGVLEIKIGAGSYTDILAAGGSFVSGGYNATLSSAYSNPLAGRQAWSGNSGGFTSTVVNLPAAAAGQNVQLRWRCGSGSVPVSPFLVIQSTGTLAYWNCENSNTVSIVDPNLSASILTTATSIVTAYVAGNPGQAINANTWSTSSSPGASYWTFSLTVNGGFAGNIATVSFDDQRSAQGPTNFTLQASQVANFSSVIYDSGAQTSHTVIASGANSFSVPLSNLTGSVFFRINGYKAGSANGTWRIDNLNVQGGTASASKGWYVDSIAVSDPSCCNNALTPFQQWQIQYFGSTNNPSAASDFDADGDGLVNLDEFQSGTVPTNSTSALRITDVAVEGTGLRVTWSTAAGTTNACERSSGSAGTYSNDFTTIFTATNIVGTTTNCLDVGAATNFPARYYRIHLVP